MAPHEPQPVDVLFIMGADRSGSTILERSLAAHDGTVAVGEIGRPSIWLSGFAEERLCTCRVSIRDCDFWGAVRAEAFGGTPDPRAVHDMAASVNRMRYVPMMRAPILRSRSFRDALPGTLKLIGGLYAAIAATADGRLIIDSTKNPAYAHLLSLVPGVRVGYLHLVRDSRAVGYSHQRVHKRPDVTWTNATTPRTGWIRTALTWDARYAASLALIRPAQPAVMQLRYEDFAADAPGAVRGIDSHLRLLGMAPLGRRRPDADPLWYHSVHGNPMRFGTEIEVRPDNEWLAAMPARARLEVGTLTLPFLALHKFRVGFR